MEFADLGLNTEHELIKSHSCSGKMERRYSEMLGDRFQEYQDFSKFPWFQHTFLTYH